MQKADTKKAKQCLEKALAYRPGFWQASYLLCIILMEDQADIKGTIQEIQRFEKIDRTQPFSHLLQAIIDFGQDKYQVAIQHFQNSLRFTKMHSKQRKRGEVCLMAPNFPSIEHSAALQGTNPEVAAKFQKLFGFHGRFKYSVPIWQHLTLCYHKINRLTPAQKCMDKTLKKLTKALLKVEGKEPNDNCGNILMDQTEDTFLVKLANNQIIF